MTVFGGDEELGLGPDTEAVEIWKGIGLPEERIVPLPRSENFWQAGPTGPCGPCSELYYDRGEEFGAAGELPGDDTDRFLEFWNHVFMGYELAEDGSLSALPMRNIDTGMGLERMAAILQDVPSVFETDLLRPLIELAEELSGRSYGEDASDDAGDADRRRPLARHGLPDRRRRRPLERGPRLHPAADHAAGDPAGPRDRARGPLARPLRRADDRDRWPRPTPSSTPSARRSRAGSPTRRRASAAPWSAAPSCCERLIADAREEGTSWIEAAEAFKLHDTYGFPYDLTKELLAEQGLSVDDQGFEELMEEQRERARGGTATAHGSEDHHGKVLGVRLRGAADPLRRLRDAAGHDRRRRRRSATASGRS